MLRCPHSLTRHISGFVARKPAASAALAVSAWFTLATSAVAQAPLPVFLDHLDNGFQDWGWAPHTYTNASPVHSGTNSIAVTISSSGYQGLQIYHSDLNSGLYSSISFWLNGGTNGGQKLQVYGLLHIGSSQNTAAATRYQLSLLPTNSWQQFTIPLSALGVANTNNFTGFAIQDRINASQPTFYLDDILLNATPAPALNHLSVNAGQVVRSVDARWFASPQSWGYYGVDTTR